MSEPSMSIFREPTNELPGWASFVNDESLLVIHDPADTDSESVWLYTYEAEALLEVLLDICPNAKALANNWLLEEQKREYMKGGREP